MADLLASYAVVESNSRGRAAVQPPHPYRSNFERDRDRIIHSEAFRRLEGKTQVFTPGINDSYRNRLTHSIEVAQVGRTIAKALRVNETLTEAICLGHDIGHSPFGHVGEMTLNELMADHGGFEHNEQALRVVDFLERPYPNVSGLNLMYETRLGLARHESTYDTPQISGFSEARATVEGQIAGTADRIAYNCHDLEDGMRSRLLTEEMLSELKLFCRARERIEAEQIENTFIRRTRIAKTVIDLLVSDCIETTRENLRVAGVQTVEEVCRRSESLVGLSLPFEEGLCQLELFLLHHLYESEQLLAAAARMKQRLSSLFAALRKEPGHMPEYYRHFMEDQGLERTVCDYIAGMTDRYCQQMTEQLGCAER